MGQDIEDLVMDLSTTLLSADGESLAPTIRESLKRLCGALGADRAYVLKASVEGRSAGQAFEEWWEPGIEQRNTPIALLPVDAQRFWMRALRSGEVIRSADVEELDTVAPDAAAALRNDGVRSILFVPLRVDAGPVGFVGFEARRNNVDWDERTVKRMRTVGELLVGAVERCQADAERDATAADLAARNAELERSNRELHQFASIVSHDLSQPLVLVRGFVDALSGVASEHPARTEEAASYAEAARRSVDRMRALIDDVLALAQAGGPLTEATDVPLGQLVREVVADLSAFVAEVGADVVVGELPTVRGGPTPLRQLFQNLIANALKYRHPDRSPVISVSAASCPDGWQISVTDNGRGIPADRRRDVFEMFVRSDETVSVTGLGIGLAVCARVVANHGGRIWIDENPSGGTIVHVTLPADRSEAAG